MKAEQLLLNPNKATLAELVDVHNLLVRHIFANGKEPVHSPSRFDDVTLADIRAVYTLLTLWGYLCKCVVPKLKQPYAGLFYCSVCQRPYQEPLKDE